MSLLLLFKIPLAGGPADTGDAQLASGTGSALQPLIHIKPNALLSSGTGSADSTPTTLASDDFSDTVASSFGTADVGGAWTVAGTAAEYDKAGGLGVIEVAASGIHFASLATLAIQDSDISVMTKVTTLPTGGSVFSFVTSRTIAATDLYYTQLEWRTTGGIRGGINRRIGNTGSGGTLVAIDDVAFGSLTYTAGDWVWMRMQTQGVSPTTIRLKIWKDGTAEPVSWQQETTDSTSPLQSTGGIGIGNNASSGLSNGPAFTSFETFGATTLTKGASANIKPNAAVSNATGASLVVSAHIKPFAGIAAATGAAANATGRPHELTPAEVATGTGAAINVIPLIKPNAGLSSGTGAAHAPPAKIEPLAAVATGTGSAYDATVAVSADVNAPAELATATGTALIVSALIKPNASAATAIGTANNAIPHVKPNAALGSATGSASNVSESIKPSAALSSGTGAAFVISAHVKPNAGLSSGTGAALDATAEVTAPPQLLRPIADLSGNWHGEDARTTTLYTSVDDDPFEDATYVESPDDPTSSDFTEFDLPTATDPLSSANHVIRYRYGGEGTATLIVELRQGATVIASWSHIDPSTPTLAEQTLTSGEADAITDYSDLRIRVRAA